MSDAFKCDKCFILFEGRCKYPVRYGEDYVKKEYCDSCWDKLNKAAGLEIDIK